MLMKDIGNNQSKLEINTHDFNVPKNHIFRFVVKFIGDGYPKLEIEVNTKKKCRSIFNPHYVKINCLYKIRAYRKC